MDFGSDFHQFASGSCRRRAMGTAPRRRRRIRKLLRRQLRSGIHGRPASLTITFCAVTFGNCFCASDAFGLREAVPLPIATGRRVIFARRGILVAAGLTGMRIKWYPSPPAYRCRQRQRLYASTQAGIRPLWRAGQRGCHQQIVRVTNGNTLIASSSARSRTVLTSVRFRGAALRL